VEVLIPIIAILMVFGAPTYIVKRMLDLKEKKLELERGARAELEGLREERKLLVERLDALESVVHHGDYELNQKLKQIALEEKKALPAKGETAPPAKDGAAANEAKK
jgi:hypothetical protein